MMMLTMMMMMMMKILVWLLLSTPVNSALYRAPIVRSRVCVQFCIVCGMWLPCLLVCKFDRNEVLSDP